MQHLFELRDAHNITVALLRRIIQIQVELAGKVVFGKGHKLAEVVGIYVNGALLLFRACADCHLQFLKRREPAVYCEFTRTTVVAIFIIK